MESIEKLREYIEKTKSCISPMCRRNILIISDEIVEEHEKVLREAIHNALVNGEKRGFQQALETNASYEKGRKDAENDAVKTLKRIADAATKGKDIFLFGVIYTPQETDSWERIIADACDGIVSEQSLIDRCKVLAGG